MSVTLQEASSAPTLGTQLLLPSILSVENWQTPHNTRKRAHFQQKNLANT
jgi:hypothetical protein